MKSLMFILLSLLQAFTMTAQFSTSAPTPNDKVKALILKKTKDTDDLHKNACYNSHTNSISIKSLALFANHPIIQDSNYINSLFVASRILIYRANDLVWSQTQISPNTGSLLRSTQIPCTNCTTQLLSLENIHIFNISEAFPLSPNCDDLINNYNIFIELWMLGHNNENSGPAIPITVTPGCNNILPSECFINATHYIREQLNLECSFCE